MSENIRQNNTSEEIDLGVLLQKIKEFFKWIIKGIYNIILFYRKYAVILLILIIIGFGAGYFLDVSQSKTFKNEVIVVPNFGSVDYLYTSIEELEAKRNARDVDFFKAMGMDSVNYFSGIEIEPIADIYSFLRKDPANLDAFKVLKSNTSMLEDLETAKQYKFHKITLFTKSRKNSARVVSKILGFLNKNDYYNAIKEDVRSNIGDRIETNKQTIGYINDILRLHGNDSVNRFLPEENIFFFGGESQTGAMGKLVIPQQELFKEIDELTIRAIDEDKVIKDVAIKTNIPKKGITTSKKWLFPLLLFVGFSGLFLLIFLFRRMKEIATEA